MTPRTLNFMYLDSKLSYDHFTDANGSILQKLKMVKTGFKVRLNFKLNHD